MNSSTLHSLDIMVERLRELDLPVTSDDVHFSLMNAQEWIWIDSDLTGLDYPSGTQFGIYVDERGELFTTTTAVLDKPQQVKANKLIRIIKATYSEIINDYNDELVLKG